MLGDRIDWLAEGLESDELPSADEWTAGRSAVEFDRQSAEDLGDSFVAGSLAVALRRVLGSLEPSRTHTSCAEPKYPG